MLSTDKPVFPAGLAPQAFLQVRQVPEQCSGAVQQNTDVNHCAAVSQLS